MNYNQSKSNKNALKRSFYMSACERCARKINTCYEDDTEIVHTQRSKSPKSKMASGNTLLFGNKS